MAKKTAAEKAAKTKKSTKKPSNILVTGGAGFIGSNLVLTLQAQHPEAGITVIDDFRSGDFKNLIGFKGDVVAKDVSRMDFSSQFGKRRFDAIFHLASITDTTLHDQKQQVHDNVEGFRNVLEFARPAKTPIVYASSAATYGIVSGVNTESDPPLPANVYAFSKVVLDNLARMYAARSRAWKIVGVRYFNVYGPREAHKGIPASMIWHLSQQIKAGKNPRIFKRGEQLRDFIYVKDAVKNTILALGAPSSGVYNTGSGQARTFNDLIEILNRTLGTKRATEYFDNPHKHYQNHTEADLARSRKELGYEPDYSLEKGVEDYMNWLKSQER
ncbi:MAG: ADP-glyceromanno-heptose 6-epimerase [Deltaproteobacteria bacterium]|nr:ADP-glyceromanno-heptose 6-epimerase [Deltaproteobacteria bacterium]